MGATPVDLAESSSEADDLSDRTAAACGDRKGGTAAIDRASRAIAAADDALRRCAEEGALARSSEQPFIARPRGVRLGAVATFHRPAARIAPFVASAHGQPAAEAPRSPSSPRPPGASRRRSAQSPFASEAEDRGFDRITFDK
jgi:hypothetical protein